MSGVKSPASIPFDSKSNALAPETGAGATALPADQGGVLTSGKRASDGKPVIHRTDDDGRQVIKADSLPLPSGASTEAKQDTGNASLASIDTKVATEATVATLATQATAAAVQGVLEAIRDTAGIKKITDALPTGDNTIGRTKLTDGNNVLSANLAGDSTTSKVGVGIQGRTITNLFRWLLVDDAGKLSVSASPPTAPPGTTEFVFAVSPSQLTVGSGGQVSSPHNSDSSVIASGKTLRIQLISAGTEGDPAESGSKVEVYWVEGAGGTEHLIERLYSDGASETLVLPETRKARDGTQLDGNGTNTFIRVRRTRLSSSAKEIDFVVRGYTEDT